MDLGRAVVEEVVEEDDALEASHGQTVLRVDVENVVVEAVSHFLQLN